MSKSCSDMPQQSASRPRTPSNPAETLARLLTQTEYEVKLLERMRQEQKQILEVMQKQLKALKRITIAAEVWLLIVILGLLAGLASCCLGMDTITRLR